MYTYVCRKCDVKALSKCVNCRSVFVQWNSVEEKMCAACCTRQDQRVIIHAADDAQPIMKCLSELPVNVFAQVICAHDWCLADGQPETPTCCQ